MLIHEMSQDECRTLLSRASIGRLGCSLDDQPYVVPVCLTYEPDFIYVFSTLGQKIKWMRANPKVCVQIDEIAGESRWTSVIVNGRYNELPEPKYAAERAHAHELLAQRHRWWLNALAERHSKSGKDALVEPLFFSIQIESISGLRATNDE
jgi:uncharacterized protein